MRCCRKACGRHRISLVNSNSKVSHHKRDPGSLEADICGEVDNKVHLISTKLTAPSALNVTVLIHQHASSKLGRFDDHQVYLEEIKQPF